MDIKAEDLQHVQRALQDEGGLDDAFPPLLLGIVRTLIPTDLAGVQFTVGTEYGDQSATWYFAALDRGTVIYTELELEGTSISSWSRARFTKEAKRHLSWIVSTGDVESIELTSLERYGENWYSEYKISVAGGRSFRLPLDEVRYPEGVPLLNSLVEALIQRGTPVWEPASE